MNEMDREAFEVFRAGTSQEARVALGHLLRNAMQPAMLVPSIELGAVELQELLERHIRALRRMSQLVDELVK